MCFSTRCLTTGSTGVSVTRRTKFLKSFFLSRVSMGKVLEKITIVSKKFNIYMVSRFDWSILILFFSLVGTYASIGVKVSHRVEIMYFFHIFNFCEIRSGVGLWLVNTHQYGCHPPFWVIMRSRRWNVMNPTKGGPYLVVVVRGILLPWVILRREGRHDHIWISNLFVTSVPVSGVMPLYGIWAGSTYIWERRNATGL